MGQKPSWLHDIAQDVIDYYNNGHSADDTAAHFGNCTGRTVLNLLDANGVPRRSRGEGRRWTPEAIDKRRKRMTGKPSPAKGKTWKVKKLVRKPNLRGDKNPKWKGGKTPLLTAIRTSPRYAQWRESVFRRDKYTCVFCGMKSGNGKRFPLNADHITPLSVLVHTKKIVDIDMAYKCDDLWDISNGRTLCVPCHQKTDTFGVNLPR